MTLLFKLAMAVLTSWLLITAAQHSVANLYSNQVNTLLANWRTKAPQSEELNNEAVQYLEMALAFQPENPHLLLQSAKVQQWLALQDEPVHQELLHKARSDIEASINLRPHWPLGYSDLAYVLWLQKEVSPVLFSAMNKAYEYGPFLPQVNLILSKIGLDIWPHLPANERRLVSENIAKAMLHPSIKKEASEYFEKIKRIAFACVLAQNYIDSDSKVKQYQLPNLCR